MQVTHVVAGERGQKKKKKTEATWTIHAKLKSWQSDVWQEKPKSGCF